MSSGSTSPFTSATQRQATWSWKIQNFSTPQTYAAKSAAESKWQSTATAPTPIAAASTSPRNATPVAPVHVPVHAPAQASTHAPTRTKNTRKRRRLNNEEEEMKMETATSVATNLELDQILTSFPDADSPFEDEIDVVKRLLPYHIYQHPRHDLDEARGLKGKSKAIESDLLKKEVEESKFSLESHKRLRSLEQRLKRARLKPGEHPIPDSQAIVLERLVLESDHAVTSALEQELSSSRSELDRNLRAQRSAKASSNSKPSTAPPAPTPYYGYNTPTFSASSTPNFQSYYSSYTYPYGQAFVPGVTYTPPASTKYPSSSSIPGASSFQANTVPHAQSTYSSTTATTSASTTRPTPVAIPLQLPVTSLPALQSLGILPVPKASLPSANEPQPAAVLLGSSNNGSMLSLEINAALLQAPQMSGLAILLSSLVKMTGGTTGNVSSSPQIQSTSSASSSASDGTSVAHQVHNAARSAAKSASK
ncbi:hypothetical protein DFH11DRAFT_1562329 [Phellopilus nigrolimitatus]|nr:hypothetical protein DFH11DRAFT_1562329 [Phellopilus nigrolimitatus]